jgi:hypothetical protein
MTAMLLCLAGLLHCVRNDGLSNPSLHRNTLVIARRRSRRGNPGGLNKMHFCLAESLHCVRNDSLSNPSLHRNTLVIARRRSRRGNPGGLNKMHFCLAGLLHCVRNDGKGAMNYRSINNLSKHQ